jgi:hypothetical protein
VRAEAPPRVHASRLGRLRLYRHRCVFHLTGAGLGAARTGAARAAGLGAGRAAGLGAALVGAARLAPKVDGGLV